MKKKKLIIFLAELNSSSIEMKNNLHLHLICVWALIEFLRNNLNARQQCAQIQVYFDNKSHTYEVYARAFWLTVPVQLCFADIFAMTSRKYYFVMKKNKKIRKTCRLINHVGVCMCVCENETYFRWKSYITSILPNTIRSLPPFRSSGIGMSLFGLRISLM